MAPNPLPTRKQILGNFASLVSGMGLARLMTALALILVARQVGPSSYGQYLACLSLAKLTSVAFSWGLDGWLLWRGGSATNHRTIAVQSGVALAWKLMLGCVWFLGLYAASHWLNPETFPPAVLLTTALIVWTDDLTNTVWSVFKSTLQNDVTFKIITSVQFVLVLVTVALMLAHAQSLITFLWARLIVSALGCLFAVYILRRNIGIGLDAASMWPIFRAATPFAISLVLALIYERADITLVAQFLGAKEAGIYGPASTIVTTLFLVPAAAYAVMVPVFTRAHALGGTDFLRTLRLFVLVNAALGLCFTVGLALSSNLIIHVVYGERFAAAGPILAILSLVLGIRCVTFALGAAVVGTGRQTQRLYVQVLAAALSVFIDLAIVRLWGIQGVAWVYVFTELVVLVGYWMVLGSPRPRLFARTA
ncbi:MAG: oligosaccharide flippase family protein, partial [Nitrososphaerales archaeon]